MAKKKQSGKEDKGTKCEFGTGIITKKLGGANSCSKRGNCKAGGTPDCICK